MNKLRYLKKLLHHVLKFIIKLVKRITILVTITSIPIVGTTIVVGLEFMVKYTTYHELFTSMVVTIVLYFLYLITRAYIKNYRVTILEYIIFTITAMLLLTIPMNLGLTSVWYDVQSTVTWVLKNIRQNTLLFTLKLYVLLELTIITNLVIIRSTIIIKKYIAKKEKREIKDRDNVNEGIKQTISNNNKKNEEKSIWVEDIVIQKDN